MSDAPLDPDELDVDNAGDDNTPPPDGDLTHDTPTPADEAPLVVDEDLSDD